MAEEEQKGCEHPDKRSVCFNCKLQYTCGEAHSPEYECLTVCAKQEPIDPDKKPLCGTCKLEYDCPTPHGPEAEPIAGCDKYGKWE